MSESRQSPAMEPETFEDLIDSLYRELELAVKWQRPSILFSICGSEDTQAEAELALEGKLIDLGQKVFRFEIKPENADIATRISELSDPTEMVFFIFGLSKGGGKDGTEAYAALNKQREYFIENHIRVVFWLSGEEAVALANHAPDYWAFRHRVIEFVTPQRLAISKHAPAGSTNHRGKQTPADSEFSQEAVFTPGIPAGDLPGKNEASAVNANLHLTLGILYWRRGDLDRASKYLRTALETAIAMEDHWFEAECLNAIALVYTNLGHYNEAIEAYRQAVQIAPNQVFPWNNLGKLYSRLGQNDEALSAYQKAIEHNPEDPIGWNGMGNIALQSGKIEEAIHAYKHAVELAPNLASPWNALGNAYERAGKTEEAVEAYQKAVDLNKYLLEPLTHLGAINLRLGRYEAAVKIYQKVVELTGDSGRSYSQLGLALQLNGKLTEAVTILKKGLLLLDDDKEKAIVWNRLGDAYKELKDQKNAMAAYQKAVELDPGLEGSVTVPDGASQMPAELETVQPAAPGQNNHEETLPALEDANDDWLSSLSPFQEIEFPMTFESPSSQDRTALEGDESAESENIVHPLEMASNEKTVPDPFTEEASLPLDPTPASSLPLNPETAENEVTPPEMIAMEQSLENENSSSDARNANDWNALGHSHLQAGDYDEAISAYTRAIEAAQDFNWPYIHNLAMAHYQKGEHKGKSTKAAQLTPQISESEGTSHRYEEPPTQPIPPRPEKMDEGKESPYLAESGGGNSEGYTGRTFIEDANPMPRQVERNGELSDWLSELEDEKTISADSAIFDQVFPEQAEAASDLKKEGLEEIDPDTLADTAPIPAVHPAEASLEEPEKTDPGIDLDEDQTIVEPRTALEWNEQGNIHLKAGACDRAIAAYIKAIELSPKFGWPYSNLGLAYSHKGKYLDAIPLYRKSIELLKTNKEKAISWNRMGDAYRRLNDHDNAVFAYQKAVELDSGTHSLLKRVRMSLLGNVHA